MKWETCLLISFINRWGGGGGGLTGYIPGNPPTSSFPFFNEFRCVHLTLSQLSEGQIAMALLRHYVTNTLKRYRRSVLYIYDL